MRKDHPAVRDTVMCAPARPRRKTMRTAGSANRISGMRAAALAGVLVASTGLLAACGSSGAKSPPSAQTLAQMVDRYAACMRHHGVPNFYPQQQSGNGPLPANSVYVGGGEYVTGVDPTSSTFQRANGACQHLLPPHIPLSAAELRQQLKAGIKAVDCLHTHGFPGFPDPVIDDGNLGWRPPPSSIDTSSPQFIAARKTCGKIIPPFGAP
jgi:hypothetical protein